MVLSLLLQRPSLQLVCSPSPSLRPLHPVHIATKTGTVLPLHAHKNLEVALIIKGVMHEKAVVNGSIPVERQTGSSEIDWLDSINIQLEER